MIKKISLDYLSLFDESSYKFQVVPEFMQKELNTNDLRAIVESKKSTVAFFLQQNAKGAKKSLAFLFSHLSHINRNSANNNAKSLQTY